MQNQPKYHQNQSLTYEISANPINHLCFEQYGNELMH
ncbi:hypothetical protein PSE_2402 [Pseudovibrio sp. FO-BEG1]|nr:hypothetical protein PSE_2402 [Pseudovibrio sp. FO-BEG1]